MPDKRLDNGLLQVWRDENEVWRVTWLPDEPLPNGRLSGHTFSPGDADLPDDFPNTNDPHDLLAWGTRRWGKRPTPPA